MVHYDFNLGSPAANIAPERTGGRYATRHAGLKPRSIRTDARQPKARLNRFGFAGSTPTHCVRPIPQLKVAIRYSNCNATLGIHRDSGL